MRKWRVARVLVTGTLHVMEQEFWTKKGAQETATHLNLTFGAFEALGNALLGHNYFVTSTDKIPALEAALELAKQERKTK